eukprot:237304-Hanusia_phi.AAC.1
MPSDHVIFESWLFSREGVLQKLKGYLRSDSDSFPAVPATGIPPFIHFIGKLNSIGDQLQRVETAVTSPRRQYSFDPNQHRHPQSRCIGCMEQQDLVK